MDWENQARVAEAKRVSPLLRGAIDIGEVGANRCILRTDTFREWLPPGPPFLRMFIGRLLLVSGIDEDSIRIMVRHNPAFLLGLPPIAEESETLGDGQKVAEP
jgi:hypothetical protein